MISVTTSGTQTAVINTEHILATSTTVATYVYIVDTSNLAAGDTLELRIYLKTLSTSSLNVAYYQSYTGAQSVDPVKISVPVPISHSYKATLKQTAGTGRNFDWEVMQF